QNGARGNLIAHPPADKTPARFGGEEGFLVPPSIIEREMRRAGLLQTGNVENPCSPIRVWRDAESALLAKLGQTEGTAIVVKSRIRHPSFLSCLASRRGSAAPTSGQQGARLLPGRPRGPGAAQRL